MQGQCPPAGPRWTPGNSRSLPKPCQTCTPAAPILPQREPVWHLTQASVNRLCDRSYVFQLRVDLGRLVGPIARGYSENPRKIVAAECVGKLLAVHADQPLDVVLHIGLGRRCRGTFLQ